MPDTAVWALPPEETVASAWVAPVCVEGAEAVALAVGVAVTVGVAVAVGVAVVVGVAVAVGVGVGVKPMVGVAGVGREPGEGAVELSPVALGVVAVVGLVDVEGKPEWTDVPLLWGTPLGGALSLACWAPKPCSTPTPGGLNGRHRGWTLAFLGSHELRQPCCDSGHLVGTPQGQLLVS